MVNVNHVVHPLLMVTHMINVRTVLLSVIYVVAHHVMKAVDSKFKIEESIMGYKIQFTNGSAKIDIDNEGKALLRLRECYPQCPVVYRSVGTMLRDYLKFTIAEDNTGTTITGFDGETCGDDHLNSVRPYLNGAISWSGEDGRVWVQSFGLDTKRLYNIVANDMEVKLLKDMGITVLEIKD